MKNLEAGAAIGAARCELMPQCVIGRVSRPRNRGSSQMCGFSGGVVRIAISRGDSYRRSHATRLKP